MSNKGNKEESQQHAELGFQTFFGTILIITIIPILLDLLNLILFYKEEYLNKQGKVKQFSNCECNSCKGRLVNHNKRVYKRNFSKSFYIKLVVLMILIYWSYKCFIDIKDESEKINYKNFDPYFILRVSSSSSVSEIKKAYHKLLVVKHPDKLIKPDTILEDVNNIRKEFIMIVKAYEILTDPDKKDNFEKYGDLDGPKSNLHVVLPSFFFNKTYHYPIIIGFLILIFSIAINTCTKVSLKKAKDNNKCFTNTSVNRNNSILSFTVGDNSGNNTGNSTAFTDSNFIKEENGKKINKTETINNLNLNTNEIRNLELKDRDTECKGDYNNKNNQISNQVQINSKVSRTNANDSLNIDIITDHEFKDKKRREESYCNSDVVEISFLRNIPSKPISIQILDFVKEGRETNL